MIFTVIENTRLNASTWLMRLRGDTSSIVRPGQFVNVKVDDCFLRRPISLADWDDSTILLAYQVVGKGTSIMATAKPGQTFDILSGLGNGFDPAAGTGTPFLLGGGIGVAPLYGLAKTLIAQGTTPHAILGFNSADRAVMVDMFRELDIPVDVATVDGSMGTKGFVTDVMRQNNLTADYIYACGPMPMLRAVSDALADTPGELSLEVRMACGFGVCACCPIKTIHGPAGVCKKGPVFKKEEIIWED